MCHWGTLQRGELCLTWIKNHKYKKQREQRESALTQSLDSSWCCSSSSSSSSCLWNSLLMISQEWFINVFPGRNSLKSKRILLRHTDSSWLWSFLSLKSSSSSSLCPSVFRIPTRSQIILNSSLLPQFDLSCLQSASLLVTVKLCRCAEKCHQIVLYNTRTLLGSVQLGLCTNRLWAGMFSPPGEAWHLGGKLFWPTVCYC